MNRGAFSQRDPIAAELSSFDYMDYWMNSIHAHTAKNTRDSVDHTTLSPPIFIVGTHRNSLHDAPELQAKLVRAVKPIVYGQSIGRHLPFKLGKFNGGYSYSNSKILNILETK